MADYDNPRPSSQPVGSVDLAVAKDDLITLDLVVAGNAGDVVTNRKGRQLDTLAGAIDKLSWDFVGLFADGVTFTKSTDYAVTAAGDQWIYTGSYPFSAPAWTVPSAPLYQTISARDHSGLTGLNDRGHGLIHRINTTVSEVATGRFIVGDKLTLSDRSNAKFNVVSGGTPDGFAIIDAGGGNTALVVFDDNVSINWIASGTVTQQVINSASSVGALNLKLTKDTVFNPVVLPVGMKIDLNGFAASSVDNDNIFTMLNDTAIKNGTIAGAGKSGGSTLQNLVFFESANNTQKLDSVILKDSGGKAFDGENTVTSTFNGPKIINTDAVDCNIGMVLGERLEYASVIGGRVTGCNQGVIYRGGNNTLSGVIITDNVEGLRIAAGQNDAHGVIANVTSNHNTTNLYVEPINSKTQILSNCYFYDGIIHLDNCEGVQFIGGEWGLLTVREEGCKQCFVKDVRLSDQIVSEPNYNSTQSELLFYGQVLNSATNAAIASKRIQGVYAIANNTATTGGIGAGETVLIMNAATQEAALNPSYSLQTIYNTSTGEMPLKSLSLRGGRFVDISAQITIGRTDGVDLDPSLCRVYLRNKTSGAKNAEFRAGNQNTGGAARIRMYELDTRIIKENYEFVVENNTGAQLTFYNNSPTQTAFPQLSRVTISEV